MMYMERRQKTEIPYIFLGKLAFLILFMAVLFLFVLYVMPERSAAAGNDSVRTYQIISVEIEEGDSLWSIATEYYSDEFLSVRSFITEIKRMNSLSSDTLYAGSYLLIPQYVTE
ncbi:MAG: LysM peptidoglycan-binding domain-containing protein [Lachnospiraceae bacterium]|nr:LysM peptidoglycan-binding domain-containing protein [Lachnospiraceae bacterium]